MELTWERAAGRLRRPLGVPVSGVPPPEGGNWPLMARASIEEHPGAQMDAERPPLLQPFNDASSLIVMSRVTDAFVVPFFPFERWFVYFRMFPLGHKRAQQVEPFLVFSRVNNHFSLCSFVIASWNYFICFFSLPNPPPPPLLFFGVQGFLGKI